MIELGSKLASTIEAVDDLESVSRDTGRAFCDTKKECDK